MLLGALKVRGVHEIWGRFSLEQLAHDERQTAGNGTDNSINNVIINPFEGLVVTVTCWTAECHAPRLVTGDHVNEYSRWLPEPEVNPHWGP